MAPRLTVDKTELFKHLEYEPHPGQLEVHNSWAPRRVLARARRVERRRPPMTLRVGEVRVYPAPARERRSGLLAWASVEIGGIVIDGFCVRRTAGGRRVVVFPRRTDARGRQHPIVWLPDRRDRQAVQDRILAAVDVEELAR